MEATYAKRLSLLYALCLTEALSDDRLAPSTNLDDYDPLEAAGYLACYITFKAIQHAERSPVDERIEQFDMLSVYQAYAMLVCAFLTLPLTHELSEVGKAAPHLTAAQVIIAKSSFAGIADAELIEIIDSCFHKF